MDEKLAYFAGIIDGEGCISAYFGKDKNLITLSVSNTNRRIIEYLQPIFNIKISTYNPKKEFHRLRYSLSTSCRKASEIIFLIKDLLCIKHKHAHLVKDIYDIINKDNNLQKRIYLLKKIKHLNDNSNKIIIKEPKSFKDESVFLSYIAGIIDGEGHISIKKTEGKYYLPRIEISNTNKSLILYLCKKLNGAFVRDRRTSNNRNLCYTCSLSSKNTMILAKKIEKYIIGKKEQIEILIKFYETQNIKYGRGGIPKEILEKREKYFLDLKKLHYEIF